MKHVEKAYAFHSDSTGELTLSEWPLQPLLEEIFVELDATGAADFYLDRDLSPLAERE